MSFSIADFQNIHFILLKVVLPGTPGEPSLMTPLVEERTSSETDTQPPPTDDWEPLLFNLLK